MIDMIEPQLEVETTSVSELTLADQFKPSENQLSIPALLCDEKLLEELRTIPNKMGFKIGEVADMLGVKQYVLRYWESEFDVLKPKKAANNQRYFTRKDVENAYLIRKLLHRDRFSIEGAIAAMSSLKSYAKKEIKNEDTNKIAKHMDSLAHLQQQITSDVQDLILHVRRVKRML